MSDAEFIKHAKAADAAYLEFKKWQRFVDKMEDEALALVPPSANREVVAAVTLKKGDNHAAYEICTGTRNLKLQVAMMEAAMAALHRTPGW